MAFKSSAVFLFACFLLIATEVTSYTDTDTVAPVPCPEEAPLPAPDHVPIPVIVPVPVPVRAPAPTHYAPSPVISSTPSAPVPVHAPAPTHYAPAPVISTPSAPVPVHAPAPTHYAPSPVSTPSGRTHLGYCVPKCQERCKAYSRRIRPCVRVCTKCCEANNRCVPLGYETCPSWDSVIYHGESRKCP